MRRGLILKLLVGVLLVVATAFGATTVIAEENELPDIYLQVSPVSTRLKLDPTEQYDGSIKVSNVGKLAFDFKIYASPYNVEDLTYYQNFNERGNYNKITNWISFDQTNYPEITPGQTIEVFYHINVPADAPGGGQYAVIFAETAGKNNAESSIQTINRVGHTIYATVSGDTREEGELVSMEQKGLYFEGNIGSSAVVKNSGNVDFTSIHKLRVESIFGAELYNDSKNLTVIADTSRQVNREWDETPMVGLFKVTNEINFLGQNHYSETKLVLVMPVWLLIILIAVIVGLILLIVIKLKKRGKKTSSKKTAVSMAS